ncbi:MAG: RNA-binding S4 domain-containing protein [Clostridia bacterium]|nr:RNA-binding S4 domain-containing protein [Clostridia bacterium]
MEKYKQEIKITTEFIKLDQLLKFANIAESGAMAKEMIADEIVSVNGETCTQRGKKIRPNDSILVEFEDEIFEITVN